MLSMPAMSQVEDSTVVHYWDSVQWEYDDMTDRMCDFVLMAMERDALHEVPKAYCRLLDDAEADERRWYCLRELADEYFYNGNALLRDDEVYIPIVRKMMQSRWVDESDSVRLGYRLEMLCKNRVGHTAADLTLRVGKEWKTLSQLADADTVFVLFFDPECESCRDMIDRLRADQSLSRMCRDGRGKVILIDVEARRRAKIDVPSTWVYASDKRHEVTVGGKYHLPSVPRLYHIDRSMRVVSASYDLQTFSSSDN